MCTFVGVNVCVHGAYSTGSDHRVTSVAGSALFKAESLVRCPV